MIGYIYRDRPDFIITTLQEVKEIYSVGTIMGGRDYILSDRDK